MVCRPSPDQEFYDERDRLHFEENLTLDQAQWMAKEYVLYRYGVILDVL